VGRDDHDARIGRGSQNACQQRQSFASVGLTRREVEVEQDRIDMLCGQMREGVLGRGAAAMR
jgi:DNA topoisomerase IB